MKDLYCTGGRGDSHAHSQTQICMCAVPHTRQATNVPEPQLAGRRAVSGAAVPVHELGGGGPSGLTPVWLWPSRGDLTLEPGRRGSDSKLVWENSSGTQSEGAGSWALLMGGGGQWVGGGPAGQGRSGRPCSADHEGVTPGGERIHRGGPIMHRLQCHASNRELSLQAPGIGSTGVASS